MSGLDPRLLLARDGVADAALEGLHPAERYIAPTPAICALPHAAIRRARGLGSEQFDQLLFGERFDVLVQKDGWAFGQAGRDGYVGWAKSEALQPPGRATHRVSALRTYAFAEPDIKASAIGPYSLNALVTVEAQEGAFYKAQGGGWFAGVHLAEIGAAFEADPAAVAERFLGAPYLWGGRTSLGLDCSGLVQQALYACGRACPRDSDQQRALGCELRRGELRRGDLVFWRGHVGIMLDGDRLVHANAHHMAVAIEPLDQACARIRGADGGEAELRRA